MAEPVTLEEAKVHIRVTADDEDDLITALIIAARQWVEMFTGLILVEREVFDAFDSFDCMALSGWPIASDATLVVGYVDGAGDTQAADDWWLKTGRRPARVSSTVGATWPTPYEGSEVVTVTYTAGYATPADVPQALKQAMLLLIGHWYSRRETVVVGATVAEVPLAVSSLVRPYCESVL
jgi:uncharacterized phiE125 gp8 family phage protein